LTNGIKLSDFHIIFHWHSQQLISNIVTDPRCTSKYASPHCITLSVFDCISQNIVAKFLRYGWIIRA